MEGDEFPSKRLKHNIILNRPLAVPAHNAGATVLAGKQLETQAQLQTSAGSRGALPPAGETVEVGVPADIGGKAAPLEGLVVFLHGSIPLLQRRTKIVSKRLQDLGAAVPALNITASSKPDVLANVTHIVLHPSEADIPAAGAATASIGEEGGSKSRKQPSPATVQQVLQMVHGLQQRTQATKQAQKQKKPQHKVQLVSDAWLDAVLQAGRYIPEKQYSLNNLLPGQQYECNSEDSDGAVNSHKRSREQMQGQQAHMVGAVSPRFVPDLDPSPDAPMGRFAVWLGHWQPAYNSITTQVELVLNGSFSEVALATRGPNETVRHALKELEKYEIAVAVRDAITWGPGSVSHEALTYAHAAAVVRGCSFALSPALSPSRLQKLLPFVGAFTAKIIHQLLTTGTCDQLEAFRHDQPVQNSQGQVRSTTAGAATRALFTKLPGVGPTLAEKWYSLGYKSFEALLQTAEDAGLLPAAATDNTAAAAVAAGGSGDAVAAGAGSERNDGVASQGQPSQISQITRSAEVQGVRSSAQNPSNVTAAATAVPFGREALYSLQYSSDLLEAVPKSELDQMQHEVLAALSAVTGAVQGWKLQLVGGGRRSDAVHDMDLLISHDDGRLIDGLVEKVYSHLVAVGRLVPEDVGFCRIQKGRMPGYKTKARTDVLLGRFDANHQMDSYDHIWGIFISPAGKRRRLDLMFISPASWMMAVIGWTGSKQYLRFLRQHAGNCGMNLNSHYLMRKVDLKPHSAAMLAGSSTTVAMPPGAKQDEATPKPTAAVDSLVETVSYVRAAVASGSSRVVLSVPDEVPPTNRTGKEWWPEGWQPATAAAAAAGVNGGSASGSSMRQVQPADATAEPVGDDMTASCSVGAANAALRAKLSALVVARIGSDRAVEKEQDLFELLGVRYLSPGERNC